MDCLSGENKNHLKVPCLLEQDSLPSLLSIGLHNQVLSQVYTVTPTTQNIQTILQLSTIVYLLVMVNSRFIITLSIWTLVLLYRTL